MVVRLAPGVAELDAQVAKLKLASMDRTIDELSDEQVRYLASYDLGT